MDLYENEEELESVTDVNSFKKTLEAQSLSEEQCVALTASRPSLSEQKAFIDAYVDFMAGQGLPTGMTKQQKKTEFREAVKKMLQMSQGTDEVFTKGTTTFYKKGDRPGAIVLANFVVKSRKIVVDSDESQMTTWVIAYTDSNTRKEKTAEVKLRARDFKTLGDLQVAIAERYIKAFIENWPGSLRLFLNYVNDVANVPEVEVQAKGYYGFHEKILVHTDKKGETQVMVPDGETDPGLFTYTGRGANGLYSIPEPTSPSTAQEFVQHFIGMNNPLKTRMVLGWMASSLIENRIPLVRQNGRLPILFLHGLREVGKSVMIKIAAKAFGWQGLKGNHEEISIKSTSIPEIRDMLSSYANMPVILGEYRNGDLQKSNHMLQFVLSVYDKFSSSKKGERRNGQERESISQNFIASMVILGNDYIEDEAASSRILRVDLTAEDRNHPDCKKNMDKAYRAPAGCLGAVLYRWVLDNWDTVEDLIEGVYSIQEARLGEKDDRGFHAAMSVAIGLTLINKAFGEELVSSHQIDESVDMALGIMKEKASDTIDKQLIEYLVENHERDGIAHKTPKGYEDVIAFHPVVWERFREYMKRNGIQGIPPTHIISKQTYGHSESMYQHQVRIGDDDKNRKCLAVDLKKAEKEYGIPKEDWTTSITMD